MRESRRPRSQVSPRSPASDTDPEPRSPSTCARSGTAHAESLRPAASPATKPAGVYLIQTLSHTSPGAGGYRLLVVSLVIGPDLASTTERSDFTRECRCPVVIDKFPPPLHL